MKKQNPLFSVFQPMQGQSLAVVGYANARDTAEVNKVIYTDTFKWEFYEQTLDSHRDIILVDRIRKGRGYTYKWKNDAENEFHNLLEKLKRFLLC